MLSMMQGDAYNIYLTILNESGEAIADTDVSKVYITFGGTTKSYPDGAVSYADGEWAYPVTQAQTIGMSKVEELQVRVKLISGDVEGAKIGNIYILPSSNKEEM